MPDIINQVENTETGQAELWITIKDASDLLGISERHTWRILLQNAWKTRKLPNKDRKKTYVLRADVEKYYNAEQERQRLEQLKPPSSPDTPDNSDKSDKISVLDKSDSAMKQMSDNKNLPVLLSDYKTVLIDLQKKQEQLIAKATVWKSSAIWLSILAVVISSAMGYLLYDTKTVMSDTKREMSDMINVLSDNNKGMTNRVNDLSDKVVKVQNELLTTKEALFQKEIWIYKLEQIVPRKKKAKLMLEKNKEE